MSFAHPTPVPCTPSCWVPVEWILVFSSTADIRYCGDVYWRETKSGRERVHFKRVVRRAFNGTYFRPTHVLTVTYFNQDSRDKPCCGNGTHDHGLNTYQTVIGTDGNITYVIFNYGKIEWTDSPYTFYASVSVSSITF